MVTSLIAIDQVYVCRECGNMVEVLRVGGGELVCCGEPMELLQENTVDAAREKHVPVIEKTETGYRVSVGSVAHPMEEKHYIEWIELLADGQIYRKYLQPGDAPVAEFVVTAAQVSAREHCNLHGLWKGAV
ncbi:MAG: desulfoferrodoxin [Armatimonadota bacterium]